jgi:PPOX class probable FMN-dependent enzyme
MARIETVSELRKLIPEPRDRTKLKIQPGLDGQGLDFIKDCAFCLIATTSSTGRIEVSPKGDEPGFVQAEDARTLLVPERAGNNLAFGLQNILETGRVGLIFLIPGTGETLRVSGRAELRDDADLIARFSSKGRPALLVTRVVIEHCYFHCARSLLRANLWQPETWPEARRISFGKILAPRLGGDAAVAEAIEASVEEAYTTGLWTNDASKKSG